MKAEKKEVLTFLINHYIKFYVITFIFVTMIHYWAIDIIENGSEVKWVAFDTSLNTLEWDIGLRILIPDLLLSIPISALLLFIYCIYERKVILGKWRSIKKIVPEYEGTEFHILNKKEKEAN